MTMRVAIFATLYDLIRKYHPAHRYYFGGSMEALPIDCLRVVITFRGRHEGLRTVSQSWKHAFDSNKWLISIANVYNLKSFRAIYASCDVIVNFFSKRKSDLVFLNKEKNVIVPLKVIAGSLFHDDNTIETLRYRDNRAQDTDFTRMPNLTSLELSSSRVTDALFEKMPLLKELKVTNVETLSLKNLPKLKKLELQVFFLRHFPVIQPGLESFSTRLFDAWVPLPTVFASLVTLDIRSTRVCISDSDFEHLFCLKQLYMDEARHVTENALVHIPGLEVLHTKSGKVACSAVGHLKELVIRNIEFHETFNSSAKMKAASVEKIVFHRLDVPATLFSTTKVESLYMVCCQAQSLRNVGTIQHCKGMRLGGVLSDYDCDCSRYLNFP